MFNRHADQRPTPTKSIAKRRTLNEFDVQFIVIDITHFTSNRLFANSIVRPPAFGEFFALLDPFITRGAAFEAFEPLVHPGEFRLAPGGDLVEMPDAHGIEHFLQLRPDAPDQFEIIALAVARLLQKLWRAFDAVAGRAFGALSSAWNWLVGGDALFASAVALLFAVRAASDVPQSWQLSTDALASLAERIGAFWPLDGGVGLNGGRFRRRRCCHRGGCGRLRAALALGF